MADRSKKSLCRYGENCYQKNPQHLAKYHHPLPPKDKKAVKNRNVGAKNQSKKSDSEHEDDVADISSKSWTFVKGSPPRKEATLNRKRFLSLVQCIEESENQKTELSCEEVTKKLKELFLVEPSADLLQLWNLALALNPEKPRLAFKDANILLVGPFDILAGENIQSTLALCHWRFPLDPPEMQTVMVTLKEHFGFWRDEPSDSEPFIVSGDMESCVISYKAPNLIACTRHYLEEFEKGCHTFEKSRIVGLLKQVKHWAAKENISIDLDSKKFNLRKKRIASKTFNEIGIFVPIDSKTDVGYRPLIETEKHLRKICSIIIDEKSESKKKEAALEVIEKLVSAANIANDECDFGNGLELGMDLFCTGSEFFHQQIFHLLTNAYTLLNRTAWSTILEQHLKNRFRLVEFFNALQD